jgi:hypothetical protein
VSLSGFEPESGTATVLGLANKMNIVGLGSTVEKLFDHVSLKVIQTFKATVNEEDFGNSIFVS